MVTTSSLLPFSEVARPTVFHTETVQRTNGSPEDPPTCLQGEDDSDGDPERSVRAEPGRHPSRERAGVVWVL